MTKSLMSLKLLKSLKEKIKDQRGEMATLLTIVSLGLMLVGVAAGTFVARRTGKPLEMFQVEYICAYNCKSGPQGQKQFCYRECIPGTTNSRSVSCASTGWVVEDEIKNDPACSEPEPTSPPPPGTCTEGEWKYTCTNNVCPDPNNKVMVGVPFRCESGQWVNKNPAGECTSDCPLTCPLAGGSCIPENPPTCADVLGKFECGPGNICCKKSSTPPSQPTPTPGGGGGSGTGSSHFHIEGWAQPGDGGKCNVVIQFVSDDGCDGDIRLDRDGVMILGINGWNSGGQIGARFTYSPDTMGALRGYTPGNTHTFTGWIVRGPRDCGNSSSTLSLTMPANCQGGGGGGTTPGPGTPVPTQPGGGGTICGNACTECILTNRTDIIPYFLSVGWKPEEVSCPNHDRVVSVWCSATVDPVACNALKTGTGACAPACGGGQVPTTPPGATTAPTSPPAATTPPAGLPSGCFQAGGTNCFFESTYQTIEDYYESLGQIDCGEGKLCCKPREAPPGGATATPTPTPTTPPTGNQCNVPPDKCVSPLYWIAQRCGSGYELAGSNLPPGCTGWRYRLGYVCCKPIPTLSPTPIPSPTEAPTPTGATAYVPANMPQRFENPEWEIVGLGYTEGRYTAEQVDAWVNAATRYPGAQIQFWTPPAEHIIVPGPEQSPGLPV